jgi:hypothetical protein
MRVYSNWQTGAWYDFDARIREQMLFRQHKTWLCFPVASPIARDELRVWGAIDARSSRPHLHRKSPPSIRSNTKKQFSSSWKAYRRLTMKAWSTYKLLWVDNTSTVRDTKPLQVIYALEQHLPRPSSWHTWLYWYTSERTIRESAYVVPPGPKWCHRWRR